MRHEQVPANHKSKILVVLVGTVLILPLPGCMACSLGLSCAHTVNSMHVQSFCMQTYKLLRRHGHYLKNISLKIGLKKKKKCWEATYSNPLPSGRVFRGASSAANKHGEEGVCLLFFEKLI